MQLDLYVVVLTLVSYVYAEIIRDTCLYDHHDKDLFLFIIIYIIIYSIYLFILDYLSM